MFFSKKKIILSRKYFGVTKETDEENIQKFAEKKSFFYLCT